MPRAKGSKNRRTLQREVANKIAAARAELVKNAPPLDFSMPLDSLDVMEQAMRHFYFRANIEERLGDGADWRRVDQAFMQAVHVAEKVARYRHAQRSAVRLSGDLNARPENVNLDELLASIRADWAVIGPLIEMDPAAPQGSRTEGGLSAGSRRIERDQRSGA
jgi:hypothetical protein